MKCPVHIQTKEGLSYYCSVYNEFESAKRDNKLTSFKNQFIIQSVKAELAFINWIDSTDLETKNEVEVFKKESDLCAIRSYFCKRIK